MKHPRLARQLRRNVKTLSAALLLLVLGCKQRRFNAPRASPQAVSARAHAAQPTVRARAAPSQEFTGLWKFTLDGVPASSAHTFYAKVTGEPFTHIQFVRNPSQPAGTSNLLGADLLLTTAQDGAAVSNGPWRCDAAERLIWGERDGASTWKEGELCLVTLTPDATRRPAERGVVLSLVGLDAQAEGDGILDAVALVRGVRAYFGFNPLHRFVTSGIDTDVVPRPFASGAPARPNAGVDETNVLAALNALDARFNPPGADARVDDDARQMCLLDVLLLSSDWSDLQAHYFCAFPQSARACYANALMLAKVGALNEGRLGPGRTLGENFDAVKATHAEAFASCRTKDADWKGIGDDSVQKALHDYIMPTIQGAQDFNIAQANEVLNAYYKGLGKTRPRRLGDPFPEWQPEQIRYLEVMKRQLFLAKTWTRAVGLTETEAAAERLKFESEHMLSRAPGAVVPEAADEGGGASSPP